ncbi:hypothetical protein, partial [Photobacterium sanguinicancri]
RIEFLVKEAVETELNKEISSDPERSLKLRVDAKVEVIKEYLLHSKMNKNESVITSKSSANDSTLLKNVIDIIKK